MNEKQVAHGTDRPWTGDELREYAEVLAKLIDAGVLDVRADLNHLGRGEDDVTFRLRRSR